MTQRQIEAQGYTVHHTSWQRGYVSRKSTPDTREATPYNGKFGKGYTVALPSWRSTQYRQIAYYTNA